MRISATLIVLVLLVGFRAEGQTTKPAGPATQSAVKSESTFTSRTKKMNFRGIDPSDKTKMIQQAQAIDKKIAEYLKKNETSELIANSMYEGKYEIGMTEAAARIISGEFSIQSRTATSKTVGTYIWVPLIESGKTPITDLVFGDDKITEIIDAGRYP